MKRYNFSPVVQPQQTDEQPPNGTGCQICHMPASSRCTAGELCKACAGRHGKFASKLRRTDDEASLYACGVDSQQPFSAPATLRPDAPLEPPEPTAGLSKDDVNTNGKDKDDNDNTDDENSEDCYLMSVDDIQQQKQTKATSSRPSAAEWARLILPLKSEAR